MIILLWLLNFAISVFNAWACGKAWTETKQQGGAVHFMNWMGAIMSAVGFTWCYSVLFGFVGTLIPIEQDDGTSAPLLDLETVDATLKLGYLVIIIPCLGSGLAITVNAWRNFWERRTIANGGVAAWNTFAQVYNLYGAVRHVPGVVGDLSYFFKGAEAKKSTLVIVLVVLALAGGVLTTLAIIRLSANTAATDRRLQYTLKFDRYRSVLRSEERRRDEQ